MEELRYTTDVFPPESEYYLQKIRNRKLTQVYHSHDFYELVAVTKGSCEHFINGSSFTQNNNELVILKPRDSHMFLSQSEDLELLCLSVKCGEYLKAAEFFGENADYSGYDTATEAVDISECISEIISCRNSCIDGSDINRESRLKRLLCIFISCKTAKSNSSSQNSADVLMKKILSEMKAPENMRDGISAMCRISGYSKPQLYRIAKKGGIMSLNKILTEIRLETAYKYIACTDEMLESISEMIGYKSFSHFNKLFKARYGITPSELRKTDRTNTV